jgi:hypothetical protein
MAVLSQGGLQFQRRSFHQFGFQFLLSFILIHSFCAKLCAGELPIMFLSRRNKMGHGLLV